MKKILKEHTLSDMIAVYLMDEEQHIELMLYPQGMRENIIWDKNGKVDSLVQISLEGDAAEGGFAAGHTYRNSQTVKSLCFAGQRVEDEFHKKRIITKLKDKAGLEVQHILEKEIQSSAVLIKNIICNHGENDVKLEMAESFSLGMLTPFADYEKEGQLLIHRIRSKWSSEGMVETVTAEALQLVPSWSRHGVSVERFGQIGSLPVRKYFPFAAVEDRENNVVWASQLACGSSWQMELYRRDENLCMSGGLADFTFGHWAKTLKPGEEIETPSAYVTVCKGDFDEACQRLVMNRRRENHGQKLPVIFNEFCTTWGNPCEENIQKILEKLQGKDFDYFVIDAGWYADEKKGWEENMGDWEVCDTMFPHGLEKSVQEIKNAGFRPGIWFEAEVIGRKAKAQKYREHFLKKAGNPICSGTRYFWDMREEWVQNYLKEHIIKFLAKYQFEYVKIDYNESVGIGCDGAESLGQGLYESILASKEFFVKMKENVPGLVLEICSSGGHRLEPSFLAIADLASFSDAHEELEIPVIAANLHRVMAPEKMQIWSVIRETDSEERICYSMAATFLGVLCLSGDILNLSERQWQLIDEGIRFYRKLDLLVKEGISVFFGTEQKSYRHLQGWQGILRKSPDEKNAFLVIHTFEAEQEIKIELSGWKVRETYEATPHTCKWYNGQMEIGMKKAFEAAAFLLEREA